MRRSGTERHVEQLSGEIQTGELNSRTASYEDIKSRYDGELYTQASPNAGSGTLDAVAARFGIPVIYTSQSPALAEENAASWLSKHFTYWHLEEYGLGRILQEGDV